MKYLAHLLAVVASTAFAGEFYDGPVEKKDIPYAEPALDLQKLDVYWGNVDFDRPVIFWIHGGGWQAGDKADVKLKPGAFVGQHFVFVSINYRLLPKVDMGTLTRDVAKAFHWVHDHIAKYHGDPNRIIVMGHSAGAQLAALLCTDEKYLKEEGLSLSIIKGCVPVDGDTYDIPAIIEVAETRWRVHNIPPAKMGHRQKFGDDPEKHKDFSAVNHIAKGKNIPPFLIFHVADHPDTTAQARRLGTVLKEAEIPVRVFGAKETNHNRLNDELGGPDDAPTKAMWEFVNECLKK